MSRKFWIDTDCGLDDAQAIFIALRQKDIEVVGISTVNGNCSAKQASINVCKVLKIAGRSDIPLYEGCHSGLIQGSELLNCSFHGSDGLGDATDHIAVGKTIEDKYGVVAMAEAIKKYPGKLELIALGPLTNVAVAMKMDSELSSYLKHCYIMGGSDEAVGNVTSTAEFNFFADPEAACIVLKEMVCQITIVGWNLCRKNGLSWEWYDEKVNQNTEKARFLKMINEKNISDYYDKNKDMFETADQLLMAVAVNEAVITKSRLLSSTVELCGSHTRGMMIINLNWKGEKIGDAKPNVRMIEKIDLEIYKNILYDSLTD